MQILEEHLPLYLQMIDPTSAGPADPEALRIFAALNSLNVIAVRPILLAVASVPQPLEGMKFILRLVVRRIVVGNLGTGNVERRFGEAARKITETGRWESVQEDLRDLDPDRDDFVAQLHRRSFNKSVLTFLRRSIVEKKITPENPGTLHFIWSKQLDFGEMSEEDGSYWGGTIGNTYLSTLDRRPREAIDWHSFKDFVVSNPVQGEWISELLKIQSWDVIAVDKIGKLLAEVAGEVWY